jgi:hypothetical protein
MTDDTLTTRIDDSARPRRPTLALTALALALAAIPPALLPVTGVIVGWFLLTPALVSAYIVLMTARPGRRVAFAALAAVAVASIVAVLWGTGLLLQLSRWLPGQVWGVLANPWGAAVPFLG